MLKLAIVGALAAWVGACSVGCASMRAVDSSRAIEALTAGESNVTYTAVSGQSLGLGPTTFAIPTVPGKDVDFALTRTPDGGVTMTLQSRRSPVVDILLAGVAGIDAEKFAADAATRDFYARQADKLLALVTPVISANLARYQSQTDNPPARPSRVEQLRELLTDPEIRSLLQGATRP